MPTVQVLIADFFFILFALGWFGAGLAQQALTQSSVRAAAPGHEPGALPGNACECGKEKGRAAWAWQHGGRDGWGCGLGSLPVFGR